MGHYVYKYVLNDEILYVGKNDTDLVGRLRQHGVKGDNIKPEYWDEISRADIYYVELPNSTMADVFESEMIRRYSPKCNVAKKSEWCGLPFKEPSWTMYRNGAEETAKFLIAENSKLKRLLSESREQRNELLAKNEALRRDVFDMQRQIGLLTIPPTEYFKNVSDDGSDGLSFDDVIRRYRDGYAISYVSECYNHAGELECKKIIYTTYGFGSLNFTFVQRGARSASGSFYYRRDDKTMKQAEIARLWKNRGSNTYYECKPPVRDPGHYIVVGDELMCVDDQ